MKAKWPQPPQPYPACFAVYEMLNSTIDRNSSDQWKNVSIAQTLWASELIDKLLIGIGKGKYDLERLGRLLIYCLQSEKLHRLLSEWNQGQRKYDWASSSEGSLSSG